MTGISCGTSVVAMDIPIIDDVIGQAEDVVTDAVGGAADAAAQAAIDAMIVFAFDAISGAIETINGALIDAMETTSSLDLTSTQFAGLNNIRSTIGGLALVLLLGFFLVHVLSALARGEPGPIIRAALVVGFFAGLGGLVRIGAVFGDLAAFGLHLVRISQSEPSRVPALEEIPPGLHFKLPAELRG